MRRMCRLLTLIVAAAGCGNQPDHSNLSVRAPSAPERHSEASREAAALERQNREAEARFFTGSTVATPEPEPSAAAAGSSHTP